VAELQVDHPEHDADHRDRHPSRELGGVVLKQVSPGTISSVDPWTTHTGITSTTSHRADHPTSVCSEPEALYWPVAHSTSTGTAKRAIPPTTPAANLLRPRVPR
jgi:hypothetical protein